MVDCAFQGTFGSVMGVLTIFGAEKAVFKREYGSRLYNLPAYFWSRHVTCLLRDDLIMQFVKVHCDCGSSLYNLPAYFCSRDR